MFSLANLKLLKNFPDLLKIMLFVLSALIFVPFFLAYSERLFSISWSPSSVSERRRMSSAHVKQLIGFEFSSSSGIHSSLVRCRGRSAKKILNKRGLRIHPCFTPWLATNVFVSPFNFTQHFYIRSSEY